MANETKYSVLDKGEEISHVTKINHLLLFGVGRFMSWSFRTAIMVKVNVINSQISRDTFASNFIDDSIHKKRKSLGAVDSDFWFATDDN